MGGHSQVLPAHLQTAANGVQVYLGGSKRRPFKVELEVPSHSRKVTRQVE